MNLASLIGSMYFSLYNVFSHFRKLLPETPESENPQETTEESNLQNGETKPSGGQGSENTNFKSDIDAIGSEVEITDSNESGDIEKLEGETSTVSVGTKEKINKDIKSSTIDNSGNIDIKDQVPQKETKNKNPEVDETGAIEEGESHSTSSESESLEVSKVQNAEKKEEAVKESKSLQHLMCW